MELLNSLFALFFFRRSEATMVVIAMRHPYNLVHTDRWGRTTRKIPVFCDGIDPQTRRRTWLLAGDGVCIRYISSKLDDLRFILFSLNW